MNYPFFSIEIDGTEAADLYKDIIKVEIEFDWELASMFRLKLTLVREEDGTWRYVDDERLSVWNKIVIKAGFDESGLDDVFSGYITHIKPAFSCDPDKNELDVWGMDATVLMQRITVQKDWPGKKDSDIAAEIFGNYSISADVTDTKIIHAEEISTIIQRETDIQFLRRLAGRNGFECCIEGEKGYFGPPRVGEMSQGDLIIHGGDKTNMSKFSLEINALVPSTISMTQIDRLNKEIASVEINTGELKYLGTIKPPALLKTGIDPALHIVGPNATTGIPEITGICQKLFHDGDWFVTGEGEVSAARFPQVLKCRHPVTIKGVGELYSGDYYITHINHIFTGKAYTQFFKVARNALGF